MGHISIPKTVTTIDNYAFYNCSSFTSISIPSAVKEVGSYAFAECTGVKSITISSSSTSIKIYAFNGCDNVEKVSAPTNGFAYIPKTNLKTVTISEGTSIYSSTFSECANLTTVIIADTITSIDEYAFNGCTNLTQVYFKGSTSAWQRMSIGKKNDELNNAELYFYSFYPPQNTIYKYWYYDKGVITLW